MIFHFVIAWSERCTHEKLWQNLLQNNTFSEAYFDAFILVGVLILSLFIKVSLSYKLMYFYTISVNRTHVLEKNRVFLEKLIFL
jgi:hypothetical protein